MPVYLDAPEPPRRGPDGTGWNRISLGYYGGPDPQCSLRPRSATALWETTERRACAQYGPYDPCIGFRILQVRRPSCDECRIFNRPRRPLDTTADHVMVRVHANPPSGFGLASQEERVAYVLLDPALPWDDPAQRWNWTDLVHLDGWQVDSRHHADTTSEFFWLHRLPTGS